MMLGGIDIIINFHLSILPTEHLKIIKYFMLRHQTIAVLQHKHGVLDILGDRDFVSVLYDDSASPSPDICI